MAKINGKDLANALAGNLPDDSPLRKDPVQPVYKGKDSSRVMGMILDGPSGPPRGAMELGDGSSVGHNEGPSMTDAARKRINGGK
jgi:hypothetical protein